MRVQVLAGEHGLLPGLLGREGLEGPHKINSIIAYKIYTILYIIIYCYYNNIMLLLLLYYFYYLKTIPVCWRHEAKRVFLKQADV